MTGDTAEEQWVAFLTAETLERATADRTAHLSPIEQRMYADAVRRNT